jgi:hypothetical protein
VATSSSAIQLSSGSPEPWTLTVALAASKPVAGLSQLSWNKPARVIV